MCFTDKKVIITGGLGFIGSNLAIRLVALGADVTLVDSLIPEYGGNIWNIEPIKNNIHVNFSDVRDEYSIQYLIKEKDFLFNLAGQTSHLDSMNNPYPDLEINVRSQLSILEACRHFNKDIKIIFASTRQVYGKPQYLPVDESHAISPVDINGINKMAGESYHLLYHKTYGMRTSVLRLTNTYGPRMRIKDTRQTFLGIWIRNIIEGKKIQIYGDGKQIRDFNFVEDVVDALLLCAASENSNGQIFNLGANPPLSLLETALLIQKINRNGDYEIIDFPQDRKSIDIGDYYANFHKIKSLLGWQPKTSIQKGLEKTLKYYHQNIYYYV